MRKIKKTFQFLVNLRRLMSKDRLRNFPIKLTNKFSCWRKGFLPESYVIYNLKNNCRDSYLSDLKRLTKASQINKSSLLIDNKYLFANYFKDDNASLPLYYLLNSNIQDFKSRTNISKTTLINRLKMDTHYVFKSVGGGGGKGITFVTYNNKRWMVDDKVLNDNTFEKTLDLFKNTIICPKIVQDGFCYDLYPKSLNTIRILTMINPSTQKSFIAAAVLRCGSSITNGLDNWSSGGLSSNINLIDGTLSKAVTFPIDGVLVWYDKHPDTDFRISGFKIPNWQKVKKEILEIAEKHFYLPYVGWDIILLKDSFLILEANGNSDVNLLQVHEPLLAKPEVHEFYKFYKVING